MSLDPRHPLRKTWTKCAAFLFFAAVAAIPRVAAGQVTICHHPPGNPNNWHEIAVSPNAVPAHMTQHGDTAGSCACLGVDVQCNPSGGGPLCCPGTQCVSV